MSASSNAALPVDRIVAARPGSQRGCWNTFRVKGNPLHAWHACLVVDYTHAPRCRAGDVAEQRLNMGEACHIGVRAHPHVPARGGEPSDRADLSSRRRARGAYEPRVDPAAGQVGRAGCHRRVLGDEDRVVLLGRRGPLTAGQLTRWEGDDRVWRQVPASWVNTHGDEAACQVVAVDAQAVSMAGCPPPAGRREPRRRARLRS